MSVCSSLALGFLSSAAGQILEKKCLWGTNVWVCVCGCGGGGGGGAEGLETAVVGGVNPTHYNSSLWPVLGKRGTTGAYRHILSICISPFSPLQVAPDCTDSNQPLLTVPLSAHDPSHDCRMQWMMMMMQNWRVWVNRIDWLTRFLFVIFFFFFFFTQETKACTVWGPRRLECCNVHGQEQHNGSLLI